MKRAPFNLAVSPAVQVKACALIAIGKDALFHGEGLPFDEAHQFALSSRRAPVLLDPLDACGRHHPLTLDESRHSGAPPDAASLIVEATPL
jgi:hypothetical protein